MITFLKSYAVEKNWFHILLTFQIIQVYIVIFCFSEYLYAASKGSFKPENFFEIKPITVLLKQFHLQ